MMKIETDVKMMQAPDSWDHWPCLPLVHSSSQRLGYLLDNQKPRVYLGNVFATTPEDEQLNFPSFDAISVCGWLVD